jgi:hypothetical protein
MAAAAKMVADHTDCCGCRHAAGTQGKIAFLTPNGHHLKSQRTITLFPPDGLQKRGCRQRNGIRFGK